MAETIAICKCLHKTCYMCNPIYTTIGSGTGQWANSGCGSLESTEAILIMHAIFSFLGLMDHRY